MLRAKNARLLVVDIQGKLAQRAVGSELLHKRLTQLVSGCAALGLPIAYTEQLPDKLGETSPVLKTALDNAKAARFVKRTFRFLLMHGSFGLLTPDAVVLEMIASRNGITTV
jgi:hypothetical protein